MLSAIESHVLWGFVFAIHCLKEGARFGIQHIGHRMIIDNLPLNTDEYYSAAGKSRHTITRMY